MPNKSIFDRSLLYESSQNTISCCLSFGNLHVLPQLFWHGVALNDLARLSYPKETFFLLAAIIYLVVGFVLSLLIAFLDYGKRNYIKGFLVGLPVGIFIYAVAFTFGISFYAAPKLTHIALDVSWQAIEQALGGAVAGLVFQLLLRVKKRSSFPVE